MKVVIIGGGTAGSETAWRLRQQNKEIEIAILEKGGYTQYSPCALPYLLSGKIKKHEDVLLFDSNFYSYNNIDLKLGAEAQRIDKKKKQVFYQQNGKNGIAGYDKLVIAAGGTPKIPSVPGLENNQVFVLKNIDDVKDIEKNINSGEKALIIGSGYIGVELAEALTLKGLVVSLLEAQNRILPNILDPDISEKIQKYIENKGITVITGAKIESVSKKEAVVNGRRTAYDCLFVCCGLQPNLDLAKTAGLKCGTGVKVNLKLETSDKDIYACGDSVQSINAVDGEPVFSQLATTAVRQAGVIARNILGGKVEFGAVLNTSVSKFANLTFGSCGVSQDYCKSKKIKNIFASYASQTKPEYYPGGQDIFIKIIASYDGRIIGCQIVGFEDVAGRINLMSLAIKNKMTLGEFISIETCYNPAVAPIFEPLVLAAEICLKKLKTKNETA